MRSFQNSFAGFICKCFGHLQCPENLVSKSMQHLQMNFKGSHLHINTLLRKLKPIQQLFSKFSSLHNNEGTGQHDLTFGAHSCTAHKMEIFAQEFKPASYFCDWTCVHLITSRQKQGPISENKLPTSKNEVIAK